MNKNSVEPTLSRKVFLVFNYVLLIGIALLCIYPFWYVVIYTFSKSELADVRPPVFLPRGFSLGNYKEILTIKGFFPALFISTVRTVAGTALSVLGCSFLGYMFTQERLQARKFLYRMLIMTMYISGGMIAS